MAQAPRRAAGDPEAAAEGRAVAVFAPAKVNLYLHVLGRRGDGYHELDSLVAFADIGDTVRARPADDLSLALDGPFAAALAGDPDNLVLRAARGLAARLGRPPEAALALTKNLPVASGIGGGSSDAAAALKALAALWRLPPDHPALAPCAAELGADVPVCLLGRTAWLSGIGERVAPAPPLPPLGIVLVNPGVALPTPAVFKARTGALSAAGRGEWPEGREPFIAWLGERRNDLTEAAIGIVPPLGEVLNALEGCRETLLARMSGSGATCFALCADRAAAERVARRLGEARPRWWTAAGTLQ